MCRYVSRNHQKDTANHVILGTQQFKPTEFANQINLNMDNAWGILRCVIDICMKLDEGKYLIMKDPNKVRMYSGLFFTDWKRTVPFFFRGGGGLASCLISELLLWEKDL